MTINPSSYVSLSLQPQNNTALIYASDEGHVEVVKLLLALPGIDYNHKNDRVWCQYIPLLCMPQKVHT
jgi:ankyrin repeat protein